MPTVRKLSDEEVARIERKNVGQRKQVEQEYDAILADFAVGEYGDVELDEGEKRLTVRNRLKAAAARRNVKLVLSRTRGDTIRFRVAGADEAVPEDELEMAAVTPVPEPEVVPSVAPPKRRGGRPRKQAAS